ncbi:hypothetical protein [Kocuria sp. NPDC057446]|uniref:hypothetical protein n=1 Tax=Kocuria sp. NPDC057446 TaxID=3346137 RepID=UPI0036B36F6B
MWTVINQTFATPQDKNAWAHIAADNLGWRKVQPNAADGVTNTFLVLVAAKASGKQANVVLNASNEITQAYL